MTFVLWAADLSYAKPIWRLAAAEGSRLLEQESLFIRDILMQSSKLGKGTPLQQYTTPPTLQQHTTPQSVQLQKNTASVRHTIPRKEDAKDGETLLCMYLLVTWRCMTRFVGSYHMYSIMDTGRAYLSKFPPQVTECLFEAILCNTHPSAVRSRSSLECISM